jgi:alanine dehydrogenase
MPVLYLTEDEVKQVLTMDMALDAVESGLRKVAIDEAVNVPRSRCQTDHSMLHVLPAAAKTLGVLGYKAYVTNRRGTRFQVHLFDGRTGDHIAWMQADYLGQMRTGAASGVATRLLARQNAATVGVFGSGKQARTQLQAICKVLPIRRAVVYSPNEERRSAFATEMSELCGTEVIPASQPINAARDMDIVVTATAAREPVLKGEWIADGAHLNIIGSNFLGKTEIDVATVKRAGLIAVDSKDQAHLEAGDFLLALEEGALQWPNVRELGQIIAGRYPGRENEQQVTLFKSLGIGIEDIATAAQVYAKAKEQGVGRTLEL